ncbi:hypothetical protein AVEN_243126-1 [Araneus ventricosus]|uniref:Uncharacterized protein n=1 Tax=Araneus ventricosus TaxID=182803 RepID=A0A4Y2NHP8_ARAVE|nr:hypothetical protein AVEN_243126-1 [Araneus ventricosus]
MCPPERLNLRAVLQIVLPCTNNISLLGGLRAGCELTCGTELDGALSESCSVENQAKYSSSKWYISRAYIVYDKHILNIQSVQKDPLQNTEKGRLGT